MVRLFPLHIVNMVWLGELLAFVVVVIVNVSFRFTNPLHWMDYFPPLVKKDLKALGAHVSEAVEMEPSLYMHFLQ